MTKQEWDSLTEQERLKLFEELEEEKDVTHKALEQFLKKKSKESDDEKWVAIDGLRGEDFALRVSDIEYIKNNREKTEVHTKIIQDGEKIILEALLSPYDIVKKINKNL